ncbi:hypothetical protein [Kitasatospora cineracea]|uniref:Uncharacterized protein n=1 Tax=Kitasatospora cineracea TaxID=88074 RepID=A0A3N4R8K9_9ACTN|nr:hypothetical protein [Kitasatospora cineracea]RPE27305.1 hypothetical protein EDD38_7450 [Kitasatospora cineracea]
MPPLFLPVLDPSASPPAAPAPDAPKWTDIWSALGTVGATLFALAAIAVTVVLAQQDRKKAAQQRHDDGVEAARLRREDLQRAADQRTEDLARAAQERAEADQRLLGERAAADQRLAQERADWDRRQVRDWQAVAATGLLHRIAEIQPYIEDVALINFVRIKGGNRAEHVHLAIQRLQQGAYTDALALGSEAGTQLYRSLVSLVVSAPDVLQALGRENPSLHKGNASVAIGAHLRAYCRYVRLRLCQLIETGVIPPDTSGVPSLRLAATGAGAWTPVDQPPGWQEDTNTDPDDPQFTARS